MGERRIGTMRQKGKREGETEGKQKEDRKPKRDRAKIITKEAEIKGERRINTMRQKGKKEREGGRDKGREIEGKQKEDRKLHRDSREIYCKRSRNQGRRENRQVGEEQ